MRTFEIINKFGDFSFNPLDTWAMQDITPSDSDRDSGVYTFRCFRLSGVVENAPSSPRVLEIDIICRQCRKTSKNCTKGKIYLVVRAY